MIILVNSGKCNKIHFQNLRKFFNKLRIEANFLETKMIQCISNFLLYFQDDLLVLQLAEQQRTRQWLFEKLCDYYCSFRLKAKMHRKVGSFSAFSFLFHLHSSHFLSIPHGHTFASIEATFTNFHPNY